MKKKFLKYGSVAAFALVAGYSVYASQQKVGLSELAMENVEALAYSVEAVSYTHLTLPTNSRV